MLPHTLTKPAHSTFPGLAGLWLCRGGVGDLGAVYLVCLVYLVYLDRPDEPDGPAPRQAPRKVVWQELTISFPTGSRVWGVRCSFAFWLPFARPLARLGDLVKGHLFGERISQRGSTRCSARCSQAVPHVGLDIVLLHAVPMLI